MQFSDQEKLDLVKIIAHAAGDMPKAVHAAYQAGLTAGAMRAAYELGQRGQSTPASNSNSDDEDDSKDSALRPHDRAMLNGLGIDPDKPFKHRNTMFTIVACKPSRWKYPVTAQNANGTRYKFSVDSVLAAQKK